MQHPEDSLEHAHNPPVPHSSTRMIAIIALLAVTLAIPITVYLSGQQQELRQQATTKTPKPTKPPKDTKTDTKSKGKGAIMGEIIIDANKNGKRDPGEKVYEAGALITLSGSSSASMKSDSKGRYLFKSLGGGTYTITLTVPSGYMITTKNPREVTVDSSGKKTKGGSGEDKNDSDSNNQQSRGDSFETIDGTNNNPDIGFDLSEMDSIEQSIEDAFDGID